VDKLDEPYLISLYALDAEGMGDKAEFERSVAKLRTLERREGDYSYWSLEMNTPFYGWGLAGRVETTALTLEALATANATPESEAMISRGLLFILRKQDRYGIWYSTQATINVLEAMAMLTTRNADTKAGARGESSAEIFVDDNPPVKATLPAAGTLAAPVDVYLTKYVPAGTHHVRIHRAEGASRASVQLVATYYVPWSDEASNEVYKHEDKTSDALRLAVQFDKQSAQVGDVIRCNVDAERIGFRGYGMLLAEIGLPPGADVDRSSLEAAMDGSDWEINQYDVLPDRVVVYLWPRAGGTKFSFTFKPRFGLAALSAPSILYDYYNPEARATVVPAEFNVQ
jgi:hypothetical protein